MDDLAALHAALTGWFEAQKEDLPWRRERTPYRVWVSEVMLQQTQVATVVPYFERFMARLPTVEALAAVSLDEVLKLWEGLGYYSRARNLHRAARMIVAELGGEFPSSVEGLQKLPGVGRYTAGAVASIAFGWDAPVVDGNVVRIVTRLLNVEDDVTRGDVQRDLWARAASMLPSGRAGAWNEGLMELGRRVCTPRSPDCAACPLAAHCQARQLGLQAARPVRPARARTPHYDVTAAVIEGDDGRLLIAQRPPDGMLGGLWEFPGGKRQDGESLEACLRREIREELGIEVQVGEQIVTVPHAYTHFRITLYAFACRHASGEPQAIGCADWAWVRPQDLDGYAFPSTDRKIIAALRDGGQTGMDLSA